MLVFAAAIRGLGRIRMRLPLAVAAGLMLSSAIAAAAPQTQPSKDRAPDPAEKVICKRVYDSDTGSHFQSSKRICRTAAEWKEIEDGTQRVMKTIRENSGINPADLPPSIGGGPN
jgi:hypothetical protein